jgi:3-hydroxyacyl-[acyl-carrier-protein] dehydratase
MADVLLGFDQVRALLPHAYPFVLIDQVLELVPEQRIVARKSVSGNEWMFPGHFPERAIYPGVLLLESMAQAAALLFKLSRPDMDGTFLLAGVRSRFLRPVVPGEQVVFTCTVEKLISTGGIVEAAAEVDGETAVKATLTFAVRPKPEVAA